MKNVTRKNFHKILWFFKYKSTPASYLASNRLIAERSSKDKYIYSLFGATWGAHSWTTSTTKLLSNRLATLLKYLLLFSLLTLTFNFPNAVYYLSCVLNSLIGILILSITSLYLLLVTTLPSTRSTCAALDPVVSNSSTHKTPIINIKAVYRASSQISAVSGTKAALRGLGTVRWGAVRSGVTIQSLNKQYTVGLPLINSPSPQTHFVQSFLQKKNQTQTEVIRWKSMLNLLQPDTNLFLSNYNLLSKGIAAKNTLNSGSYLWSLVRFSFISKLPSYLAQNLLGQRSSTYLTGKLSVGPINTPLRVSLITGTDVAPVYWLLQNQNQNSTLIQTNKQITRQLTGCSWNLPHKQWSIAKTYTSYLY